MLLCWYLLSWCHRSAGQNLQRLQILCIRLIFGLQKFNHTYKYRTYLSKLPKSQHSNLHIFRLLYKTLFFFDPMYPICLSDSFQFLHSSDSPRRSYDRTLFYFPTCYSATYSHSVSIHAVSLWNLYMWKCMYS